MTHLILIKRGDEIVKILGSYMTQEIAEYNLRLYNGVLENFKDNMIPQVELDWEPNWESEEDVNAWFSTQQDIIKVGRKAYLNNWHFELLDLIQNG